MKLTRLYIIFTVLVGVLASCESNFKDVQRMNAVAFAAAVQAENINLKYTDSGKVKSILLSPLMMDYSNLDYGFKEFPKGVNVTLFDDKNQKTTVVADYATTYDDTKIIDMQGNVKITTADGKVLTTDQLYFDQKTEWFYTEKNFKFTDGQGGYLEGPGLDFSKDFKIFNMQRNSGQIPNQGEN